MSDPHTPVVSSGPEPATRHGPSTTGKIGERFVRAGLLDVDQVAQAVALQQRDGLRFGEAAVRLGFLSNEDVQTVLADQFNYATARADVRSVDMSLAIAHRPFGAEAEAIRQIRSELVIRLAGRPSISIAVVSPNHGEGKSYLAASLAIAFSQSGKRTLLINANLRSSGQAELLRPEGTTAGLSSMLAGRTPLGCGLPVPGFPQLYALPAGPQPPNPTEILNDPALRDLLSAFSAAFDVFIIDTPAALLSSDAQIIARQADACVLVGRRHVTTLKDLNRVHEVMHRTGAQVVGSVYNSFDGKSADIRRSGWWRRLLRALGIVDRVRSQ